MPAYNVEPYIAESIISVLAQTHSNWELLIGDDASIDKTLDIALAFSKRDSRIKVFRQKKNLGFVGNKNFLLSKASGEYIIFHDSDDISSPHLLEVTFNNLKKFDTRLSVTGYSLLVNKVGRWLDKESTCIKNGAYLFEKPMRAYPFMFANILFDRKLLDEFGYFDNYFNSVFGEDYYWFLKVHQQHAIIFDPTPLYKYRYHSKSTTNLLSNKRKLIMDKVLDLLYEQRIENGTDWLAEGKINELASYEENLLSNNRLMAEHYRIWAAKAIDKSEMKQARTLLLKAFTLYPFHFKTFLTVSYYLRSI